MVCPGQTTIGLNGPTVATGCTVIGMETEAPGQPLEEGVKVYATICGEEVLFTIGVVNVAVLPPGVKFPLAVATTPAGIAADQAKVDGFMEEVTVITAFEPEQIGPTLAGKEATGRGLTITVAVEVAGLHGPGGSLVVNVSTAVPVYPAGGVQVLVSEFGFEKVPPTFEDHVALEAAPPMDPLRAIV